MALWSGLARVALAPLPTPLHRLERFSAAVGVEVWAKRDDIGSPTLAGNKVRKLEFLLGRALADRADTLVTTGAAQSNSARASVAAAAACGMAAVLVLSGDRPAQVTANLLLDELMGAEVRFAGRVGWAELNAQVEAVADELRALGRRPVTAPVGCSNPLGTVGFVAGYDELVAQLDAAGVAPQAVYATSTSGGTLAGLALGQALAGRGPQPVGIDAGLVHERPAEALAALANQTAQLLGSPLRLGPTDVVIDTGYLGAGYGKPTAAAAEALGLLARTEGIVVDPVYSAKGLAGLVDHCRAGRVQSPVVFWHTGGWHSLFDPHYGDATLAALRQPR